MVVGTEREGGKEGREREREVFVCVSSYPGSQVREEFQEVGSEQLSCRKI